MILDSLTFTRPVFWVALAAVITLTYVLPKRWRNPWLLLASIAFYATWGLGFLGVLTGVIVVTYLFAQAIDRAEDPRRKYLTWGAIAFNIGALALMKYAGFFVVPFRQLLGAVFPLRGVGPAINILLPLGLSYLVLEMISYVIDVRRGQLKASHKPVDFALYGLWFPKLLAGPIERARNFLPLLDKPRTISAEQLRQSLLLIVFGLVRKLVMADLLLLLIPTDLFTNPSAYSGSQIFFWLLASGFHVYNDFAGYTNMARGVSGLFGVPLSVNFTTPIFSRSYVEFWTRWHISLSLWMRDYVYFPISRALLRRYKKHAKVMNMIIPPTVTMMLSGVWHFANLQLLMWGGLNSLQHIIERVAAGGRNSAPGEWPLWRQVAGNGIVIAGGLFALVPFYATTLDETVTMWVRMVAGGWGAVPWRIFLIILPSLALDAIQARQGECGPLKWPRPVQASVLAFAILILFLVSLTEFPTTPFVYQEF